MILIAPISVALREPGSGRASGPINEFPIPVISPYEPIRPKGIVAAGDGNLWYLGSTSRLIGTAGQFQVDVIDQITTEGELRGAPIEVEFDSTGLASDGQFLMFAAPLFDTIARFRPTTQSQIERFRMLTRNVRPTGVAGLNGAIWFTLFSTNQIGSISFNQSRRFGSNIPVWRFFDIPTPMSGPIAMSVSADHRSIYFVESRANKIGRVASDGAITEFLIPTPNSSPTAITTAPDGAIWFTESAANKIGRLSANGDINEFDIPTLSSDPRGITFAPDGKIYFTEFAANKIGRVAPDGKITEIAVPTANSGPFGVTFGIDNNVWFTEFNERKIGRIQLASDLTVAFSSLPSAIGGAETFTASITVNNQGPDSAAGITLNLSRLLARFQIVSCSASNNGRCVLTGQEFPRQEMIINQDVPRNIVVFPYIAAGESATATLELNLINCNLVNFPDGNVTSFVSVSSLTDRNADNNNGQLTISTSPPARIIAGGGAADIRLGPVTPGVGPPPNPPSTTFSLVNTGCIALRLTPSTLQRIQPTPTPGNICGLTTPTMGSDFNLFEIKHLTANGDEFGEPLQAGKPIQEIPPGATQSFRVRFNAQLPQFLANNPLSTIYTLPEQLTSLLTLTQPEPTVIFLSAAARNLAPIGPPTEVRLTGLVTPQVQIVPRDPKDNPTDCFNNPLVCITRAGDEIKVVFSAFDARLNVRRATFQFLDQYCGPGPVCGLVGDPITIPLEDAICRQRIVSGQSFSVITRFIGAASRPEIKHVRVTVFDDEGSATASTIPINAFDGAQGAPVSRRTPSTYFANNPSVISLPPIHLSPQDVKQIKRR
ncbi:MAG TPA: hypothetical protein VJ810_33935 [Blastocatellia bacterium]|nr:hypothetical protein [Blastocatellia bacterium]